MGQRQSTSNAAQDEAPAKTDYYDLLGVERTATDEEIKKAYRRKALELHPDRNYGNVEETTRLFAEVQSAYEVLSDPQERAWYDSHKDILLRGDQPAGKGGDEFSYNIQLTTSEDVLKLMMKFNGRLEFSDAPSGFFGGLNDFFKKLAKEEDIACQWEDQEPLDYPDFGLKEDEYEDMVRPFYAAWTGFATRKSFAWKDEYRLSDAPDRRIRRLMEKENKKIRDDAIQEYNEAVRSLVAFVRKRDPRVKNNQKSEAERQKALRDAAAAQAARSRAARQAKFDQAGEDAIPEWAKSRTRDDHEGGFSSESDVEEHVYDCVVCDKTFKSEAQFKAHEKNKKHIKLLKQLQREMKAEGVEFNLDTGPTPAKDEGEANVEDQIANSPNQPPSQKDSLSEDELGGDDATGPKERTTSAKVSEDDGSDPSSNEDDDYAPRSDVEQRLAGEPNKSATAALEDLSLSGTPATSDPEDAAQPKLGKAKQKRAKKAAQKAAGQQDKTAAELRCRVCGIQLASKNQLFSHLEEDHPELLAQFKGSKSARSRRKK